MKLLFVFRHIGYGRYYESALEALCDRGHELIVALSPQSIVDSPELRSMGDRLRETPGVRFVEAPEPTSKDLRRDLGSVLRRWQDYLRFLEPELADADVLRQRLARDVPDAVQRAWSAAVAEDAQFAQTMRALLHVAEVSAPIHEGPGDLIEEIAPDAVLVSPLLARGSPQHAYIREAKRRRIPTALLVASWDNLTTTGLVHEAPERVLVWNEAQRREAVTLHGLSAERIIVTGASVFDPWFGRSPARDRRAFCARAGLPDDDPYLLYVGSSGFIAPREVDWIASWLLRLRRSKSPLLSRASVLIRPHPSQSTQFQDGSRAAIQLAADPRAAVFPVAGAHPVGRPAEDDFFDSMAHSSAVVGVNTSALIEAAIVDRDIHVLLAERYRSTQLGAPHFKHLTEDGPVLLTKSTKAHLAGLARALAGDHDPEGGERRRRFLTRFVRPAGLAQPATPAVVEAIEDLVNVQVQPPWSPADGLQALQDLTVGRQSVP
jgi:hypothetical protein